MGIITIAFCFHTEVHGELLGKIFKNPQACSTLDFTVVQDPNVFVSHKQADT